MNQEERNNLRRLLKEKQSDLKLSLNMMAKKLGVSAPFLSRFYREDGPEPEEATLEKIALSLGFGSTIQMLTKAATDYSIDESSMLKLASGFTSWSLPLFIMLEKNKKPEDIAAIFTKKAEDSQEEYDEIHKHEELERLSEAGIPLNRSLSAGDIIEQIKKRNQVFDCALIPADLQEDLKQEGIHKIATISSGYGVVLYIIGKEVPVFVGKSKSLKDDTDEVRLNFMTWLRNKHQLIRKIYLLRQTAANNQWNSFLSYSYSEGGSVEKDKQLIKNGKAISLRKEIPDLSNKSEPYRRQKTAEKYKEDLKNKEDVILICAFEPFANNFFHEYFGRPFQYTYLNLSAIIDEKVEMSFLLNKGGLMSDQQKLIMNKGRIKSLKSLVDVLQSVIESIDWDDDYNDDIAQVAKLFFRDVTTDLLPYERLERSIEGIHYEISLNELADFLFEDL